MGSARLSAAFLLAGVGLDAWGAQAESSEWFLRGGVVAGFVTLEGYTTNGTVGTGAPIPGGPYAGLPDGFLLDDEGDDVSATLEVGVGRNVGAWAVSLGYQYRYRTDLDVLAFTASLGRPSQFHNNVETHVVDVNLLRRFDASLWSMRPFVGAGVGVAMNASDSEFIVRELPGVFAESTTRDENTTTELSWNVQVGATRAFGDRWELELRYRFVTLGTVENGPYPGSPAEIETEDGVYSHDVLVGVTYRL
jgi:opacity protein-like surface antigen